jgi:hypothetical protein
LQLRRDVRLLAIRVHPVPSAVKKSWDHVRVFGVFRGEELLSLWLRVSVVKRLSSFPSFASCEKSVSGGSSLPPSLRSFGAASQALEK